MNEILFALMLISKSPDIADRQLATFNTRNQCMEEAKLVIAQGPGAYCAPINKPISPEKAMSTMSTLMKNMMVQMDKEMRFRDDK